MLGQIFILTINSQVCHGLTGHLDGIFFSTIFVFIGVAFLEVYFEQSAIDEPEFDMEMFTTPDMCSESP